MDDINNNYRRAYRITIVKKSIKLLDSQKKELEKHAQNEYPNESCAILVGHENENGWTVEDIFLTENTSKLKVTFTISPEEEFLIDQKARKMNMEIICIFHSHPESDAIPSMTDRKFMDVNPFPWIIYSGKTKEMNCFVLNNENLEQIRITES